MAKANTRYSAYSYKCPHTHTHTHTHTHARTCTHIFVCSLTPITQADAVMAKANAAGAKIETADLYSYGA